MSTMMMMMMNMIMTVMTVTMFNLFHEGLVDNKWYVSACGFSDNNRLKTWMPYVVNKVGLLPFFFLFFLRFTTSDWVPPERSNLCGKSQKNIKGTFDQILFLPTSQHILVLEPLYANMSSTRTFLTFSCCSSVLDRVFIIIPSLISKSTFKLDDALKPNQTGTGLAHERSSLPLFGPYYAQW